MYNKGVAFEYDCKSRRVRKRVFTWSSGAWSLSRDERFVYDEWNVIMVLDCLESNAIDRMYTWGLVLDTTPPASRAGLPGNPQASPAAASQGLDLSGLSGSGTVSGIHSAGGIGGLLAIEDVNAGGGSANSYWYFYDANGNVSQLIKASDRSLAVHYEYDPYGNTIAAIDVDTSGYVNVNSIRFSTKWLDTITGKYYYIFRYYSPRLGRWLSRDPVQESGGSNLLAFVWNSPPDRVNYLGVSCCPGDRYGSSTYARTCGLAGCGVQDCTDCYICAIKETRSRSRARTQ